VGLAAEGAVTQFNNKSFSVNMGASEAYRDNWERTFGKAAPELEHAAEQAVSVLKLSQQEAAVLRAAFEHVRLYFMRDQGVFALSNGDIEIVERFLVKARAYWDASTK